VPIELPEHQIKSGTKDRQLGNQVKSDLTIDIAAFFAASCAELSAEKDVFDVRIFQGLLEGILIILRLIPAVWVRPDIDYRRDVLRTEQLKKSLQRMI